MEKQEIRLHLNQIVSNIASIQATVKDLSFEAFHSNEQVKETVYSYLQEIGQAAFELNSQTEEVLSESLALGQLANLRNARYNQEAEVAEHNIWAIVTNDLPEIGEEVEQTELYAVM